MSLQICVPDCGGAVGLSTRRLTAGWRHRPRPVKVRWRVGLLALMTAVAISGAASVEAEVLLNEILADPAADWNGDGAVSARDDEWVEIINTGPGVADLTGFRIAGADTAWRYEFTGMLGAGQVMVVYGNQSYDWEKDNGEGAYGLRLGNTGGTLALWRLAAQDTLEVDCYTYADHEAEDDRSSGRVPDGGDEWRLFDGLNPHGGTDVPLGSGCEPSPGVHLSCPTPVEATTWGAIKRVGR